MRAHKLYTAAAATLVLLSCYVISTFAYPVYGERWMLRQPDGSMVEVRIWGDEYYQDVESLDGFTLIRDPSTRVICYARLSADGNQLISMGIRVGKFDPTSLGVDKHIRINREARDKLIEESRRARGLGSAFGEVNREESVIHPSSPMTGDVQGLVIIVDFEDQPASVARDEINNMFNEVGYTGYGNNGSVHDYFYDVSNGMLNYTNWVLPTYYRAQYPFAHYDDCSKSWPEGPLELIVETLDYLESSGLDFQQFDADGDGFIDAFGMMYAGTTHCGWAKGMWAGGGRIDSLWVSSSGVMTGRGQWIGTSSALGIGGFCHESGHSVCLWPDLYDYHGDSKGIGRYCLMANFASRTNPVEPCAYLKYSAGWVSVTALTTPKKGLAVPTSFTNTMFKYEHPVLTNEYFLIENRQQIDRDSEIPDNGLAVWHIDTNGWNSWNQMLPDKHFLVTLVQADGRWDMEMNINSGDDTDLFAAPMVTDLTPDSKPSSDWWDGSASDLHIENISESSSSMTFDFNINIPTTISIGDVITVARNKAVWIFRIELENSGLSDAYSVEAVITEDLPWATMRKESCKYHNLPSGRDAGPRGVFILASDSKLWPSTSFSAYLHITWENQLGSVFANTVKLMFHPSVNVSVVDNHVAVDATPREFDNTLSFSRSEIDASATEATSDGYATCLKRNYPNPFNPLTTVPYSIARGTWVSLDIYDATGRLVRRLVNESQPAGSYSPTWAARDERDRPVASGIYFYRLTADSQKLTKKMVLLK